jgi:hypothetical protein
VRGTQTASVDLPAARAAFVRTLAGDDLARWYMDTYRRYKRDGTAGDGNGALGAAGPALSGPSDGAGGGGGAPPAGWWRSSCLESVVGPQIVQYYARHVEPRGYAVPPGDVCGVDVYGLWANLVSMRVARLAEVAAADVARCDAGMGGGAVGGGGGAAGARAARPQAGEGASAGNRGDATAAAAGPAGAGEAGAETARPGGRRAAHPRAGHGRRQLLLQHAA